MARDENPPFARGTTFYNGGTIDSNNLGGANLEGMEYEFEDLDLSTAGVAAARTNRRVRCRIVRNVGAAALLPKRVVRYKKSGVLYGAQVDGYTATGAEDYAGVVDDWLPAAGVPVNDLCYIVVRGPCECLLDIAAAAGNLITLGDAVVALTAATSGATTGGRVALQDLTGATAVLGGQLQNAIGRALSAKTTNNTAAAILIDVKEI